MRRESSRVEYKSNNNIERWIKQLKDKEKIEFIGSPKTGRYVVKDAK